MHFLKFEPFIERNNTLNPKAPKDVHIRSENDQKLIPLQELVAS